MFFCETNNNREKKNFNLFFQYYIYYSLFIFSFYLFIHYIWQYIETYIHNITTDTFVISFQIEKDSTDLEKSQKRKQKVVK